MFRILFLVINFSRSCDYLIKLEISEAYRISIISELPRYLKNIKIETIDKFDSITPIENKIKIISEEGFDIKIFYIKRTNFLSTERCRFYLCNMSNFDYYYIVPLFKVDLTTENTIQLTTEKYDVKYLFIYLLDVLSKKIFFKKLEFIEACNKIVSACTKEYNLTRALEENNFSRILEENDLSRAIKTNQDYLLFFRLRGKLRTFFNCLKKFLDESNVKNFNDVAIFLKDIFREIIGEDNENFDLLCYMIMDILNVFELSQDLSYKFILYEINFKNVKAIGMLGKEIVLKVRGFEMSEVRNIYITDDQDKKIDTFTIEKFEDSICLYIDKIALNNLKILYCGLNIELQDKVVKTYNFAL